MSDKLNGTWQQRGITGLETAIILIAFVVVASVFAYAVLSSGFFATQKSQEAIYTGIREANNALEIRGNIIARAEQTGERGSVSQLIFTISGAMGGGVMTDFMPPDPDPANNGLAAPDSNNKVVICYQDQYQYVNNLFWMVTPIGSADDDFLLENDEMFEITIGSRVSGSNGGNLLDALQTPLSVGKKFAIEIKPPAGATLRYERTTPDYIDAVLNLN